MHRRTVLSSALGAAAWPMLAARPAGAGPLVPATGGAPDDEAFWAMVAFEMRDVPAERMFSTMRARGVLIGGTDRYAGFFDIPADAPRSLAIANAAVFTSPADVDRLADALESLAPAPA